MLNEDGIQNLQVIRRTFQNLYDSMESLLTDTPQRAVLLDTINQVKTDAHLVLLNDPNFQEENS